MKHWDLPLMEVLGYWDEIDKAGTSTAGARALCLTDRYYLLVKVMGRLDLLHPWLYARCREVERSPDGYLDLWSREHGKSSIITIAGSIQEVLKDPNITIGIFSHTAPIAKSFLATIKREFEANPILLKAFPDVLWANPHKDAPVWSLDSGIIVQRSQNPKESTIEAHGLVDGQPVSKHFKLLVYDDVVTDKSVYTPEQIIKTTAAWELSDNLGMEGGRKWHAGTRYSFGDTYEAILTRGACKPRIYPATHDGLITGNPVLFSQQEWDRRVRDQGEATVACQLLLNPLAGKQAMFDVNDLRTYEVRPETLNIFLMVDPASSKKKNSDDTAMSVIGLDYASNKYLLDGFCHKMDLRERWQRMRDLYVRWKREPGIQSVMAGYERFGSLSDLQYFEERMSVEKFSFPVQELAWPREGPGAKTDRVQRLTPDIRNHRFYIPYETDPENLTSLQRDMKSKGYGYRIAQRIRRKDENGNLYDLTERLKMQVHYFPFGGHDDLIDSVSRIYDMEPNAPASYDVSQLEPEYI